VAIGIYLPLELEVPIFAGGIIHFAINTYYRRKNLTEDAKEKRGRSGLLFASGLITGEALVGILLAIPIVLSGNPDVFKVLDKPLGAWPGIILLIGIGFWLCRTALGKSEGQR
jgi:hypothetical protein